MCRATARASPGDSKMIVPCDERSFPTLLSMNRVDRCLVRCRVRDGCGGLSSRRRHVDARRAGAVERMDHDRLSIHVGGWIVLAGDGEGPAFGGLVGLEPFVKRLVGGFQDSPDGGLGVRVGLALPDWAESLSQLVERLEPRLVSWPRSLHVSDDYLSQCQRPVLPHEGRSPGIGDR